MWRRGAPQRRGARGAFRGADAHTSCYTKCQFRESPSNPTRARYEHRHSFLSTGGMGDSPKSGILDLSRHQLANQSACTYTPFTDVIARMEVDGRLSVGDGVTATYAPHRTRALIRC